MTRHGFTRIHRMEWRGTIDGTVVRILKVHAGVWSIQAFGACLGLVEHINEATRRAPDIVRAWKTEQY